MTQPGAPAPNGLRVLLVTGLPPPNGGVGRKSVLLLGWLAGQAGVAVRVVDIAAHWRAVEDIAAWNRVLFGGVQGVRDGWRALVGLLVFRPHVIHLNTSGEFRGLWDTLLLALAALVRVRSVYHLHFGRLPEILGREGWEWWGLRGALRLADRVVVLDLATEQALQKRLPAGRVVRLPNAIAIRTPRTQPAGSTTPTVLFLGYVVPTKGMAELMVAWRELRPEGWRLRLAGPASVKYRQELQRIVGAEAAVQFLGDLPPEEAWSEMLAAEVFVLPTHTEGFPNVILEAMAAGKAMVSTRVGAIAEMLEADGDAPCGLVVEPRDAGALAAALRRLLSDAELRATLGRRAQAKVRQCYTTEVVFARLVGLWQATAGRDRRVEREDRVR